MVQPTVKTEMSLDGGSTWTDITSYTYSRNGMSLRRGIANEGGQTEATAVAFQINNRDGRFSPRNPTGPYYGTLGRNTPLRGYVEQGTVRLLLTDTGVAQFTTADKASISVTGDIDLRVELELPTFVPAANDYAGLVKSTSYGIMMSSSGQLRFHGTSDGTTSVSQSATNKLPGKLFGKRALRITLDVNNGAGGHTYDYYYSSDDTITGTWIKYDSVTVAGTISLFDSTNPLGAYVGPNFGWAKIYKLEVRNGIAGSVVANPDFTAQASGTTSFSDTASTTNTWTQSGSGAVVSNRRYRFACEASSWPSKWNEKGSDVWVDMEAQGPLRRLGQGKAPVRPAYERGILSTFYSAGTTTRMLAAYWPCQAGWAGDVFTTALTDGTGQDMTYTGTPNLAVNSTAFACSDALPTPGTSTWRGIVKKSGWNGLVTAAGQVRFLISGAGATSGATLARISTLDGSGATSTSYEIQWQTGGNLRVLCLSTSGATLADSGFAALGADRACQVTLDFGTSGTTVTATLTCLRVGDNSGLVTTAGPFTGNFSRVNAVMINPTANMNDMAIGHIAVYSQSPSVFNIQNPLVAYRGETASARFERLCSENGVPYVRYGDPSTTKMMGYQRSKTLLELLRECVDVDQGVLVEERHRLALGMLPRVTLYSRAADLTLTHSGGDITSLEPVDDDQQTRNDVSVSRPSGATVRAVLTSGTLSTANPPNGVGTYDVSVEANTQFDTDLPDQAWWRMSQGTIDEARYPNIVINLASANFRASTALVSAALDLDVGDRVVVTGLPSWMPPDDVNQIVIGYAEAVSQSGRALAITCIPESMYWIGQWNDSLSRYQPTGTTLGTTLTTSTTGAVSWVTASGNPIWTTAAGDFPMDVYLAGEKIRLSGISGTGLTQTATISLRSVNGVVKAHSIGEKITLARPTRWGL